MKNWKRRMKMVMRFVFTTGMLMLFLFLLASAVRRQNNTVCNQVIISIDQRQGNFFVDEQRIRSHIRCAAGDSVEGKTFEQIPFREIADVIQRDPYVASARVFSNLKGDLHVNVKQKQPVLRIINADGVSYYLDQYGERIPLSESFSASVIVANGNISQRDTAIHDQLFRFARFFQSHDFWRAQVEQIYVNERKEFELIPRVGDQVILFGPASDMEKKFSDLMIFYREGLRNEGWDKYKTISLQYSGQIVCTKR